MTPQNHEDTPITFYSKRRRPPAAGHRRQSASSAAIALILIATGVASVAMTHPQGPEATPLQPLDTVALTTFPHQQPEPHTENTGVKLATRQTPPSWVTDTGPHPDELAISNGGIATASIEDGDYSLGAVVEGPAIPQLNLPEEPVQETASLDPIDLGEIVTGAVAPRAPASTPRPHTRPVGEVQRSMRPGVTQDVQSQTASQPTLSLLLASFGMNDAASQAALKRLPREVAVAVAPITENPAKWISAAQEQGRAALIEAPLETKQFPWINDTPYTLLTEATASENLERLKALHTVAPDADGVATYLGDAFSSDAAALRPVLRAWSERGLTVVETAPRSTSHMRLIAREVGMELHSATSLDASGRAQSLDAGLQQLEAKALQKGQALGVALATPATIEKLAAWVTGLEERGIKLVPLNL